MKKAGIFLILPFGLIGLSPVAWAGLELDPEEHSCPFPGSAESAAQAFKEYMRASGPAAYKELTDQRWQ